MNLLLFNLVTDAVDPVLGFTSRWIRALAAIVDHIDVVTMRAGLVDVPANVAVHSVGKERGYGEPRRAVEFYRVLHRVLAARRIDACFSHMMPLFSVMAAPVLRPRAIPIVTWYTHRQLSTTLRLAYAVSTKVVSASADSWPYRRDKLVVVGHGIDEELFPLADAAMDSEPLILSVGRLSPIKRVDVMIEAAGVLAARGVTTRWAFVGAVPARDRYYGESLTGRIADGGLGGRVGLIGPVPYAEVAAWHRRAALHVSLSPRGLFDKAVLEAMACGRPSVVAHDGYDAVLGAFSSQLRLRDAGPVDVADAVQRLLAMPCSERARMGEELHRRVVEQHGLTALAARIVAILDEACGGARRLAA
jgi:glycosyltransferase involved in cell wall biosynthesis